MALVVDPSLIVCRRTYIDVRRRAGFRNSAGFAAADLVFSLVRMFSLCLQDSASSITQYNAGVTLAVVGGGIAALGALLQALSVVRAQHSARLSRR